MSAHFTILYVDDEKSVLLTLKMILERAAFRVITASSAVEALNAIAAERIDAAVLDYAMPNMNGIRLAERINPNAPCYRCRQLPSLPDVNCWKPEKTLSCST